jgi:hypothetical protein
MRRSAQRDDELDWRVRENGAEVGMVTTMTMLRKYRSGGRGEYGGGDYYGVQER